jgi:cyclophilin family peptidyl-prolyl cis-trans isomerase
MISLTARLPRAATLATIQTTVGNMELELFDQDKPVTVSNFVKYVVSGQFTNLFIQRWEPNFVIQAGGYRVTNSTTGPKMEVVPIFGAITNEYSVGTRYSNVYGTIAMARQQGVVNSASSQWFLNLTNNSFLDSVDQGFTVFGRVTAGTNVLNLFIPPPPTKGIYRVNVDGAALATVPVLTNVTALPQLWTNLIYVDIKVRTDVNLAISPTRPGQRRITWKTVAGVTNNLQYTTSLAAGAWVTYTNVVGTGAEFSLIDTSANQDRIYRVALQY